MEDFAHNSLATILILVQGQLRACIRNRGQTGRSPFSLVPRICVLQKQRIDSDRIVDKHFAEPGELTRRRFTSGPFRRR
jgi:hypothetical protein